jgi:hypothetical protein
MSQLDPTSITVGDLCLAALKECRAVGVGQSPLAEDINDAWARLQWMLQQWERKRWLVYHLVNRSIVSTGAQSYTMGPGGQIDTSLVTTYAIQSLAVLAGGTGYAVNDTITLQSGVVVKVGTVQAGVVTSVTMQTAGAQSGTLLYSFSQLTTSGAGVGATFNSPVYTIAGTTASPVNSVRPAKIESAFLRQITQSNPNQIDMPLQICQSREDYDRIALKQLTSFPGLIFLDSAWPLSVVYAWPIPSAGIYSINISVLEQLPSYFLTLATKVSLPYEYYSAIVFNLAIRLMPKYGMVAKAGDQLPGLAKDSLNVLRGANVQIASLQMPSELIRPGIYNPFSDRVY